MTSNQELWERAKLVIPGGNMLLSKRPELFLPGKWPAYYSRASGCQVWDLEGKRYIDMALMGVGTNLLGYGNPEVDDAVRGAVSNGNMSSLNCPEEVYLAEKLTRLHPGADMVRFARTGGEATAIAVRIARAASKRDKVAFCGYHGWHDWYLAANMAGDSLSEHLLPGLQPVGVPKSLNSTALAFRFNRIEELETILETEKDLGVIIMEVSRNVLPQDGFLQKIRRLATQKEIVLIFDECTSGFRQNLGGLHLLYGVEPDISVFGKALGNGYAITAVLGSKWVMEYAQSTFISSTFWTERIGSVAALATLSVMEKCQAWKQVGRIGNKIKERWKDLSTEFKIPVEIYGLPALPSFIFQGHHHTEYKTFLTQEMLRKGFLACDSVYVSLSHTDEFVEPYFDALREVFQEIARCEERGIDIQEKLEGPVCQTGFRRLN
jgi:glutamate-1-semialdehyde 2,1-aminomutase